ncbi:MULTISPECIES: acyl-CoA thioesterase [Sphingomonas]|jgi:acyl-CoA thioesterase YciA|uniref:Acyl-CoA thioesterase n=1 Tax=Sphingomonas zeae TaxID=1646122 RepID=A0A7Y6B6R2_9SPHN|nr:MULTISPECIES: acyl-CoA thioesterase [Sphingomonas]MBB4047321.1 acyl-CoA thioesterase YciA [Sphingomonas zeae]MDK8185320.1 acyl-CoA thioesterase [Sphingomonas zeae]MDK8214738.1 acyl-CoA thioesterase [Sphingomonas sp. UMB7805-LC452B]NUU48464.1 acyl-CoA thioesterase [Sphingomonas zeae]
MTALPDLNPTIRVTAMPGDANPYGDIFGGWLMGQMDLAAGSVASRHSGGRAVTIAAEGMKFHAPVLVGDEVSVYATLVRVGNTSMTIEVEAWRRARHMEDATKVTQARFVFVATDKDRKPRTVPPMAPAQD